MLRYTLFHTKLSYLHIRPSHSQIYLAKSLGRPNEHGSWFTRHVEVVQTEVGGLRLINRHTFPLPKKADLEKGECIQA